MSKIEKYREQSQITNKIIVDLNKSQGLNAIGEKDPNNAYDLGENWKILQVNRKKNGK